MAVFALQFLVTNVLFSLLITLGFLRLDTARLHRAPRLLLYSLGLGPITTTLILYYLLLIFPHQSDVFYVAVVGAVFACLAVGGRREWSRLGKEFKALADNVRLRFSKANPSAKAGTAAYMFALMAALSVFLFVYLTRTIHVPLEDSDALKYGTLGKILHQEKSMEYRWIGTYPRTGFYQVINQAPSFSLLLTWEEMTGGFFGTDQDLYFKSTSAYYALLIIAFIIAELARRSKAVAAAAAAALISAFPFFITLIQQHLDSYRIFFVVVSWICLEWAVDKADVLSFIALGVFSGFAAFAHSIGAIFALFNIVAYAVFSKGGWSARWRRTGVLAGLVFAFGWIHYLLDIVWGFGWILFKRNHTYWG